MAVVVDVFVVSVLLSPPKKAFSEASRPVKCGCLGHAQCVSGDITTFVWSYKCRANTMV